MNGRQIGYAAAGLLAVVIAYKLIARPTPNTGPSPAPAPAPTPAPSSTPSAVPREASAALPCDRACELARISILSRTCHENGSDCLADAEIAFSEFSAGRCEAASAALSRAATRLATQAEIDLVAHAYAVAAKAGIAEACADGGTDGDASAR